MFLNQIRNEDTTSTKNSTNGSNYDQSRKPLTYHDYFYTTIKNYFLQLKKTIYVKLKEAQPDTIDDAVEFQSWTLSVLAVIILSFVFICCFIPLLVCLSCKLFGCCTCTGCRINDGLTCRYIINLFGRSLLRNAYLMNITSKMEISGGIFSKLSFISHAINLLLF
uniref:Uncharacterized protein n=1 Tax=Wuchereria bancrofti TaxID=6293 RepID=A0A1I8EE62_WUCBA